MGSHLPFCQLLLILFSLAGWVHLAESHNTKTDMETFVEDNNHPSNIDDDNKCPDTLHKSPGLDTVLLAQLFDDAPVSNDTKSVILFVDGSIVDVNITCQGWTFKLWKPTEKLSTRPSCLSKVFEGCRGARFKFQERVGQDTGSGQAGTTGGCREIPTDICVERGGVDDGGDDLSDHQTCSDFYSIQSPTLGLRYIELFRDAAIDTGRAEMIVTAHSYQNFNFSFSNPITAEPLSGLPVAGEMTGIRIYFSCGGRADLSQSSLVTFSESGQVLGRGDPLHEGVNLIKIPLEAFFVGVEGVDIYGQRFVRISPHLVKPRLVVLSFTTPAHTEELHPQQNLDVGVRLRNKGNADSFSVTAAFSSYFDYMKVKISPEVLEVAHNAYDEFHVLVSVHKSVSQKINSQLTIDVTRLSDGTSTFLTRYVTATPTSVGEDSDPPSCVVIHKFSECDPSVSCSETIWEAGVMVNDLSGVFRAFFDNPTNRLMSSIAYQQVHGRLRAEARLRRDCCAPNATLLVEDYVGNRQACTLDAADFPSAVPYIQARSNPRSSPGPMIDHGSARTRKPESLPRERTAGINTLSDLYVTSTQSTADKGNEFSDFTDFWSPELLEKLKICAVIFGCVVFVFISFCAATLARDARKQTKPAGKNRAGKQTDTSTGKDLKPAFHFRINRSGLRPRSDAKRFDQFQLKNLEPAKPRSPQSKTRVSKTVTNATDASVNKADSVHKSFAEQEMWGSNEGLNFDTGGHTGSVRSTTKSSSISLNGERGDEAYSSLSSSSPGRDSVEQSPDPINTSEGSERWVSDLEPKNKAEIYESIVQVRDLLEQLEKKRAALLKSINFKHHTVPRVKQDIKQAELDWDIERVHENPKNDDEDDHDKEEGSDAERGNSHDANRDQSLAKDLISGSKQSDGNPTVLTAAGNTELSKHHDESSPKTLIAPSFSSPDFASGVAARDRWLGHNSVRETRNSVTPPEFSQGHVSMMIEGATQISLRHEIRKLRERLVQCSKDVEDAIRFEKDLYDRLSNAEGDYDSDFEEM